MDPNPAQMQLPPVRCDRLLYRRAQFTADRLKVTLSRLIRDAIEQYCVEDDEQYQEWLEMNTNHKETV